MKVLFCSQNTWAQKLGPEISFCHSVPGENFYYSSCVSARVVLTFSISFLESRPWNIVHIQDCDRTEGEWTLPGNRSQGSRNGFVVVVVKASWYSNWMWWFLSHWERVGTFVNVCHSWIMSGRRHRQNCRKGKENMCILLSTMVFSIYTPSSVQMATSIMPCFRRPDRPWKSLPRISSRYEEVETAKQQRFLVIK